MHRALSYSIIHIIIIAATMIMAACSADETLPQPDEETLPTVTVPIDITLGTDWDIDTDGTRGVPPGIVNNTTWVDGWADVTGEYKIDKVRIIAFRRKDMDNIQTGTNTAQFLYDRSNDKVVSIDATPKDVDDHGFAHQHLTASAELKKMYGYEYRVIALAYSSVRPLPYKNIADGVSSGNGIADQLKTLIAAGKFITPAGHAYGEEFFYVTEGTTFDDFKARLVVQDINNEGSGIYWREFLTGSGNITHKTDCLAGKAVTVPQFFWGYCHTGNKEPVIKYMDDNGTGEMSAELGLTGILYRGVAKIELKTKRAKHDDHSLSWMVLMADNVYSEVNLNGYDQFLTPGARLGSDGKYTAIGGMSTAGQDGEITLTAWVLPCATHLALRGFTITEHAVFNGQLSTGTGVNISSGVNGTGIISPDVIGDLFYLRRNHKYVITASDTETIFSHALN